MKNVHKSYVLNGHRKDILKNVSFDFPQNKNIAIMGRNGAGKSTLMKLLSGSERPNKGRIQRTHPVSWPLGFSSGFNGSMTGIENALFVARLYGVSTHDVIEYVSWFSELGPSLKLPIKTYSSGMKARLAFGLSMAIEFDTYLIDEITSVGDEAFKKKCKQVFEDKLSQSNVIMISHSANTLKSYCDCGVLLENGTLTYYDDINDLVDTYRKTLKA
jgi:capsular polysaccharide transport system ATP-binding protein